MLYTSKAVGEWLGITDRQVRNLRDQGVLSEVRPGVFDMKVCVRQYLNFKIGNKDDQARLVAARAEREETRGKIEKMRMEEAKGDQMYPLTPDLIDAPWPAGNSEYQVDELAFRIWHTPGHTPGGVVIACGDRLFSGDTLFAGSCGRVDLPGGSPAEMQRSLALVADLPLPDETTVYPGHESFTTLGQERRSNPYLMGEVF